MGKITSSVGLVTGIDIQGTVDKLIELQAQPRDAVQTRNEALGKQQVAITELTANLVGLQYSVKKLASETVYQQKTASSSNASLLTATVTGNPAAGRYTYTPVRAATAQQLLSSTFVSDTAPLGAGSFSFQYDGEVDKGVNLGLLNGGAGVERGKIRITDRSGASAEVDLRFATTVDDVLQAVNNTTTINVRLEARGDRFVLVDQTGQTASNLKVQQVGAGGTAASLGLSAVDVAADEATGADVLRVYDALPLDQLLDGRGLGSLTALPDLQVTFRDGSDKLILDFDALAKTATKATGSRLAANGENAQLRFTATKDGADYDGFTVQFVNHNGVTAGNEIVNYDKTAKTVTVYIDEGVTTADQVISAINSSEVAIDFTAAKVGDGTGFVSALDGALTTGGAARDKTAQTTLGDLINVINAQSQGRLKAEIRADGEGIQITDLTADAGGQFTITSAFDSPVLGRLGIDQPAVNGVITGRRLLAGLKTSLIGSLNGGAGIELGSIEVTDRSGATTTIDLSAAQTLDDLLAAFNSQAATAGVAVRAEVNRARTGLQLTDTSDATASPLIVADGDATSTATKLGLAVNANVTNLQGGSLRRQTVTEYTKLASLNGGAGVAKGQFRITNSAGVSSTISITDSVNTIGALVKEINNKAVNVQARINDAGDGVILIDNAGGAGSLSVADVTGRAAADLHLAGTAQTVDVDGQPKQVLEGGNRFTISLDADDTLTDLIGKINTSGTGLTALKLGDGSVGNPFRLSLFSSRAGEQAGLLFDTTGVNFSFEETARAQDALLLFGSHTGASAGVLVSSKTNTFSGILPGANLEVRGASTDPVVIEIKSTDESLVKAANEFVTAFHTIRAKIDSTTFYNADNGTKGPLHGSYEALRVETELTNLVSGRFFGVGNFQSLEALGISLNDAGKLALDESKLKTAFAADPTAVTEFFSKEEVGAAHKLDKLIEQLAGRNNSLLVSRAAALYSRIESNNARIDFLDERLEKQREKLLMDFYRMETAIGKIKDNLTALNSIQVLEPLTSVKR